MLWESGLEGSPFLSCDTLAFINEDSAEIPGEMCL